MNVIRYPFVPRPPWLSATLQTMRGVRNPMRVPLPEGHWLWFPLGDGDALAAKLHWPGADVASARPARPLALLLHGTIGSEDDAYLRSACRALLREGFPVLRLNLRGSRLSRSRSSSHYHIGRSEDLRDVLRDLPASLTSEGVVVAGWSLGGALVLNLLGRQAVEQEERRGLPRLLGAAAICPPLDPAGAHRAIDRNRVLGRPMLRAYRREVLAVPATDLTDRLRVAAKHARSMREFEETVSAPRFGYRGYDEFVAAIRPDRVLPRIRVPTLLLAAADDPIVPAAMLRGVDWDACPAVAPVLVAGGGHCGFQDMGRGGNLADRAIVSLFVGVAEGRVTSRPEMMPADQ
ncbi:alpha/beta fold hydrolase [Roseomonas sp. NAR14]|uniref:Alpha/beta fold hydrolase n=1 Tax=Roseomonas acroporae TaxID=2937791 RepID=A0A9X1Y5K5_9PROT|nr:alpha/beta fold hydrolase [Roseomonas acroporae]MCK8783858.1 alpha/beta fold hydrolase [Roseomonas acroporae]